MNYKFVLLDNESGRPTNQWVLSLPVVVGRCPTADITIDTISLSRRHCEFFLDPYDSLVVHDLGSKNGVYVDQRKVDKAVVRPGTEVRLGLITLRCDLTDEEMDELGNESTGEIYDLAETEPVKIVRPDDDRYEIG